MSLRSKQARAARSRFPGKDAKAAFYPDPGSQEMNTKAAFHSHTKKIRPLFKQGSSD